MITNSFFSNQRLGNQLFIYASLFGLADKYNQHLELPEWRYSTYFKGECKLHIPTKECLKKLEERSFHYSEYPELANGNWDLYGYFQSYRYWEHCEDKVRAALAWDKDFMMRQLLKSEYNFTSRPIAIHIRRGDYVNNENYAQLPISYYITALESFRAWEDRQIIIFSDDIEYCKIHFQCFDNVVFGNGNEIEDLCAGSLCTDFILSNSSYSFWMAYLSSNNGIVIRPDVHFEGDLLKTCDIKDFWIPTWKIHSVYGTHTHAQS